MTLVMATAMDAEMRRRRWSLSSSFNCTHNNKIEGGCTAMATHRHHRRWSSSSSFNCGHTTIKQRGGAERWRRIVIGCRCCRCYCRHRRCRHYRRHCRKNMQQSNDWAKITQQ